MIDFAVDAVGGNQIRRNHALEHATITLLSSRLTGTVLRGRSNRHGFYIAGTVGREELTAAASEALQRLAAGQTELAIHPFCGTNLAVAGLLSGLSAALVSRMNRQGGTYPSAVLAAMAALVVAQPLGLLAQRHLTTLSDVRNLRIVGVEEKRLLGHKLHFVRTAS